MEGQNDQDSSQLRNRCRGCLVGLACGDAVGTTAEFLTRGSFPPITSMIGGGLLGLLPGQFTDDTSMSLCLAESLLERRYSRHGGGDVGGGGGSTTTGHDRTKSQDVCDNVNVNHSSLCVNSSSVAPNDGDDGDVVHQLRTYLSWYRHGHMSPGNSRCVDIGKQTRIALELFEKHDLEGIVKHYTVDADEVRAGNGSLMRLAPVVIAYHNTPSLAIHKAAVSSLSTHPSKIAVDACRYFAALILGALHGELKDELLRGLYVPPGLPDDYWTLPENVLEHSISNIVVDKTYLTKSESEIVNGGGAHVTLETALWAFHKTDGYHDGVLLLANRGDDADTAAAVYGQLAGAYYGIQNIPLEWRNTLSMCKLLEYLAMHWVMVMVMATVMMMIVTHNNVYFSDICIY